jgi:hypothetical protein
MAVKLIHMCVFFVVVAVFAVFPVRFVRPRWLGLGIGESVVFGVLWLCVLTALPRIWRLDPRLSDFLVFWPFAVIMLALPFVRTRRSAQSRAICGSCGYDLTGNKSGVCPECGREIGNPSDAESE